jgi:hypothetical protein
MNTHIIRLLKIVVIVFLLISLVICVVLNIFPSGLHGKYYGNSTWTDAPVFTSIDKHISANLLKAFVQKELVDDEFSVEWTGYLDISKTGLYWFSTTSDAESWLVINDVLVVDNSGSHDSVQKVGSARLERGMYPVTIRYAQQENDSVGLSVEWKIDEGPLLAFTADFLSPSTLHPNTPRYWLYRVAKTLLPVCLKLWGFLLFGFILFKLIRLLKAGTGQNGFGDAHYGVLSSQLGIIGGIAALNIGLFCFAGEIVPAGDGLGWDGGIYANMVRMFCNQRFVGDFLNPYHIRRILPSGLVALVMSVFRIPVTNKTIALTFQGYHVVIIGLGVFLWHAIVRELHISRKGLWLGFWGLFMSFALAKWAFFYPVLTDTTGYILGLFLIYVFLKRNHLGVLIILSLGFFTWPNFFELGFALLIFPRTTFPLEPARFKLNKIVAAVASGIVLISSVYVIYIAQHQWFGTAPIHSVMPLSILCMAAFVFHGVKTLTNFVYVYDLPGFLKRLNVYWAVIGGLTFLLLKLLISVYTQPDLSTVYSFHDFFANLMLLGNRQPFVFFINHVVFFGPMLILALLFWKQVCRSIHEHGIGLFLMTLGGLALSIYPESRTLMNLAPFFLVFTVKTVDALQWNPSYSVFLGYLAVLYSRIWLLINAEPSPEGGLLEFSWQKLFMTSGYVVSGLSYLIQGSVVLLTGIVLYFLLAHHPLHGHNCEAVKAERIQ